MPAARAHNDKRSAETAQCNTRAGLIGKQAASGRQWAPNNGPTSERASERVAASCAAGRGSAIGTRRQHTTASPITSGTTIGHIWRHKRRGIISMRPRRKCFDLGPKEASIAFGRRTFARAACARVISVVLVCRLCRAPRLTRPRPALRRAPAQRPPPQPVGCRASPSQAALGRAHTQTGRQASRQTRTSGRAHRRAIAPPATRSALGRKIYCQVSRPNVVRAETSGRIYRRRRSGEARPEVDPRASSSATQSPLAGGKPGRERPFPVCRPAASSAQYLARSMIGLAPPPPPPPRNR